MVYDSACVLRNVHVGRVPFRASVVILLIVCNVGLLLPVILSHTLVTSAVNRLGCGETRYPV